MSIKHSPTSRVARVDWTRSPPNHSPLRAARVGTDDHRVLPVRDLLLDVGHHARFAPQVVDRDIEEALNLTRMKVERDDVVRSGDREEIGDESAAQGKSAPFSPLL